MSDQNSFEHLVLRQFQHIREHIAGAKTELGARIHDAGQPSQASARAGYLYDERYIEKTTGKRQCFGF